VRISLVAAVARGGVIGRDNSIPWRIPEDVARFREITMGHPVVMGRRTWDSIPGRFRPLPGRRNIVVTRNGKWYGDGAERAGSLEEALDLAGDAPEVFVIGGAEIYAAALPFADELQLTEIDAEIEGDTRFPPIDDAVFQEVEREPHGSKDGPTFSFVRYVRRAVA
jgi:dihydrofolate reductase